MGRLESLTHYFGIQEYGLTAIKKPIPHLRHELLLWRALSPKNKCPTTLPLDMLLF